MAKPCVFVGSSTEGLETARHIRSQLTDTAEVTIWHEGPFGLSTGFLDSLVNAAHRFDFAVLVLTPDDLIVTRGESTQAPRDNVLFECGLFMGHLGPHRTFLVYDTDRTMKMPSDLAGICLAGFAGTRSDRNLMAAVGPACDRIRDAIRSQGFRPSSPLTEVTVGAERLVVIEDSEGWLRPVQVRRHGDGVALRIGSVGLNVCHGRIQDITPGGSSAVVLPANEFFDDECVNDGASVLGAFVQAHFPSRSAEFQGAVRNALANSSTIPVEKRTALNQGSYGVGTCVFVDRPLESPYRLIIAAVTTERAGVGLKSEISFVVRALKEIVTTAVVNRIAHVHVPLLGAGHGGLRPEVTLFMTILTLSETLRSTGNVLKSVSIVVYKDPQRDRAALSLPVIEQIASTAAGMIG